MTNFKPKLDVAAGLRRSQLSITDLWIRYLAIGGSADELELEAYLLGLLTMDTYQHNLIAQALNEFFLDLGEDHLVGYW
ncbi:MAG TPA: hypothetical protein VJ851_04135 [Jatrophihabitans sp.]|nr:hypothetical protein [Jatrophihabitans sp.]